MLPSRVSVVYSDGQAQEEAVEWEAADYSRAGQVRVKAMSKDKPLKPLSM